MSDELNKNSAVGESAAQNERSREVALREARALLSRSNKAAAFDIVSRIEDGEKDRDLRVSEVMVRMQENSARAQKLAQERASVAELSGEYRARLAARENRKAEAERRKTEEERAALERDKAERRRVELEEFLRREREASETLGSRTQSILSAISCAPAVSEERGDGETGEINTPPSSIESNLPHEDDSALNTQQEAPNTDELILRVGESRAQTDTRDNTDGDLILNIGGGTARSSESFISRINENNGRLEIGATEIYPEAAARSCSLPRSEHCVPAAESQRGYTPGAVSEEYGEELRMLEEEESRYDERIADIRARRYEYSEYLDGQYDAPFAQSPSDSVSFAPKGAIRTEESADDFEQINDRLRAGRGLEDDRMIAEYERHREAQTRKSVPLKGPASVSDYAAPTEPYYQLDADHLADRDEVHPYEDMYATRNDALPTGELTADGYGSYYRGTGYRTDTDRSAISAYEREMMKREELERSKKRNSEMIDERDEELRTYEDHAQRAHVSSSVDLFAKSQLSKRLDKFYKDEAALIKKREKIERLQDELSPEENVSAIVEKISVQKELCEMSSEALGACVYVGLKSRRTKHKKIFEAHIDKYNSLCDEYETATGRALERLDCSMVDDVLEGRICRPIQNVYYHGMEDETSRSGITAATEREYRLEREDELLRGEYERFIKSGGYSGFAESEARSIEKRRSERMSAIKRAAERDVVLVGLRTEYKIRELEARRDIVANSFGSERHDRSRELRQIDKRIAKIRKHEKIIASLEREDNARYYMLAALDPTKEKLRSGARRERLEAMRLRLDVLLAERESINERLIVLYGGSGKKLKEAKITRKAGAVRRKIARSMYRKQRKLASKIDRIKAPLDMKARAYEVLNKKTEYVATFEELRYKLRRLKPKGRAKREIEQEIRRIKRLIRSSDKEIGYMMRKLRRQEERYRDDRDHTVLIIGTVVVAALCIGAWMLFGDSITAYFSELASHFSGK